MGTSLTLALNWLRAYVTNGVPSTGLNEPAKSDGVATLTDVDTRLTNVEAIAAGRQWAAGGPVRFAITGTLPANTYNNSAGTITANSNAALGSTNCDGLTPNVNDRCWVWSPPPTGGSNVEFGVYFVTQVGSGSLPWILTRATDANSAAELGYLTALVLPGGTAWGGFVIGITIPASAITLGTTALAPTTVDVQTAVATETARALAAEALLAPLASPALTGNPIAPTQSALNNSTRLSTTAYTDLAVGVETTRATGAEALKAPLASPALTGTPTAPTAAALTNTTQIATTAFTTGAVATETARAEAAEAAAATPASVVAATSGFSLSTTPLGGSTSERVASDLVKSTPGQTWTSPNADLSGFSTYANVNGAAVLQSNKIDFRGLAFPSGITPSRADATTCATNLIYTDASGAAYTTFAANQPIMRPDLGVGIFQTQKNYLLNSTSPATQNLTLAAGTYIVWGNGTGTITTAVVSGTCTGTGTLSTLQGNFQTLVASAGAVVSFTPSGSVNCWQCENNPGGITPVPTPLIITGASAATRAPDPYPFGAALLAYPQGAAGTVLIQTNRVGQGSGPYCMLGVNTSTQFYANTDTKASYIDAGHNGAVTIDSSIPTATRSYSANAITSALSWSAGTLTIGGGVAQPLVEAFAFNNGAGVTSAHLGGAGSAGTTNVLNGWVSWIEFKPTQDTTTQLWTEYSGVTLPATFLNYSGSSLPKFNRALQRLMAGTQLVSFFTCIGDSTTVGISNAAYRRLTSWPVQLAADLTAALAGSGVVANANSWWGSPLENNPNTSPVYNPALDLISGTYSVAGASLGGPVPILTNAVLQFAPGATTTSSGPLAITDTLTQYHYTGSGYGSYTISDQHGNILAGPISTAGAPGIGKVVASEIGFAGAGLNYYYINTTGAVHLVGANATLSTQPEISVVAAGASGWNVENFLGAPGTYEQTALLALAALAPDGSAADLTLNNLQRGSPPYGGGTSLATYETDLTTFLTAFKALGGDIIVQTPNPAQLPVWPQIAAGASWSLGATTITMSISNPGINISAWTPSGGIYLYDTTGAPLGIVGLVSSYIGTTVTLSSGAAFASAGSSDSLAFAPNGVTGVTAAIQNQYAAVARDVALALGCPISDKFASSGGGAGWNAAQAAGLMLNYEHPNPPYDTFTSANLSTMIAAQAAIQLAA